MSGWRREELVFSLLGCIARMGSGVLEDTMGRKDLNGVRK
jgi:hypothetical protein